ncbi:hypothetical protein D1007_34958 [Hordeum vulgare]|nr:hypothetical protein D1007_34958 [Hordeum vulgare]
MNPKRGFKRPRASEEAAVGSSAQPQKQPPRRIVSKKKGPKEPQDDFVVLCKKDTYCLPQDEALAGRPFWNKTQSLIYCKIIKTRTNLSVDVKSIDMGHMTSNPHTAYFA